MAESTLSLGYQDYISLVGDVNGFGRGFVAGSSVFNDTPYTQQVQRMLDQSAMGGIRQFYFPPPLQPGKMAWRWTFLRPTAILELPPGAQSIALPDDFGGFEGTLTIVNTATNASYPGETRRYNEGYIRKQYSANPTATGFPTMFAETPIKGTTQVSGTRWELLVYPQADQDYHVQIQYYVLGDYLTGNNPLVYGGAAHVETIKESCLAIFESTYGDKMGVHNAKFMERLAASVDFDRVNSPEVYGYNADRSHRRHSWNRWRGGAFPQSTYNGVPWS
jgi:hypothetical protein